MDRFLQRRTSNLQSLENATYPATTAELIAEFGGEELDLPNGTETFAEVLERVAPDTYETPYQVTQALLTGVSDKAIGRRRYSDRDPPVQGTQESQILSF